MEEKVPLIVPEGNLEEMQNHQGIISNPNCSTIQAVVPLKVLDKAYKIKRIIYSTYQAVSGAGQKGITDLENGILGKPNEKFYTFDEYVKESMKNGFKKFGIGEYKDGSPEIEGLKPEFKGERQKSEDDNIGKDDVWCHRIPNIMNS